MKKKIIVILSVITLLIVVLITALVLFVNNFNKDRKIMQENIKIIYDSYDKFKSEIKNYNDMRNNISTFINNFYYTTIEKEYENNFEILNSYEGIINEITTQVNVLDDKCDNMYKDMEVNKICSNYKNDYQLILKIFNNDILNYNNKLNSYNKDNNKGLELFNSKYIKDYIDYDNIDFKKEEVNE